MLIHKSGKSDLTDRVIDHERKSLSRHSGRCGMVTSCRFPSIIKQRTRRWCAHPHRIYDMSCHTSCLTMPPGQVPPTPREVCYDERLALISSWCWEGAPSVRAAIRGRADEDSHCALPTGGGPRPGRSPRRGDANWDDGPAEGRGQGACALQRSPRASAVPPWPHRPAARRGQGHWQRGSQRQSAAASGSSA